MDNQRIAGELVKLAKSLVSDNIKDRGSENHQTMIDIVKKVKSALKLKGNESMRQRGEEYESIIQKPKDGLKQVVVQARFRFDGGVNVGIGIYPEGAALFFEDGDNNDAMKATNQAIRNVRSEMKRTMNSKLARDRSAARVDLGRVVVTRSVNMDMRDDDDFERLVKKSMDRHRRGDWGDVDHSDGKMNDAGLKSGEDRLFSVYKGGPEGKFWIITEWDRSVTTVLYPSEY